MKPKSIFYSFLCIFFIILWWNSGTNTIECNIENYLIIHNYIKRSYFKIITFMIDDKKKINTIKSNVDKFDTFIIPISKKITQELGKYVRGKEILEQIKMNSKEPNINIFLFPDTFVKKVKLEYYKILIENIYQVLDKPIQNINDENCKSLLESLVI